MTRPQVTRPQVTPRAPCPATVTVSGRRVVAVEGSRVEQVLESWIVQDKWWTDAEIHRRYWELLVEPGRRVVVFHDLIAGGWFTQAA